MFLERFEERYDNISFVGGEIDPDTFEWGHYTLNDFDNALSDLDYNDPMSFFDQGIIVNCGQLSQAPIPLNI